MKKCFEKKYAGNPGVFGKTLVLLGGTSAEREVSLLSGGRVFQALQELGVDVSRLDLGQSAIEEIKKVNPDRVFIVLHGPGGEDGKIQAVLDCLNIPYTGSGHASSALAMDKVRTKQIWQAVGLPTPEYVVVQKPEDWDEILKSLGGEVFVKPDHEGSSIGMSSAGTAEELEEAYILASQYDASVLIEKKITGAEYTVTMLGDEALPAICLKSKNKFYDYDAKYISDETEYLCPAGLSEEKEKEIRELGKKAFLAIGCTGWGRLDVMADENGSFYLLEANTVPGMTSHSLVPMAAKEAGLDFNALVAEILMQTV